jgi:hypothetical protein
VLLFIWLLRRQRLLRLSRDRAGPPTWPGARSWFSDYAEVQYALLQSIQYCVHSQDDAPRAPLSSGSYRSLSLVDALSLLTGARNRSIAFAPSTKASLGGMLGSVLGAPDHPFGYSYAHLDDLRNYVRSWSEPTG